MNFKLLKQSVYRLYQIALYLPLLVIPLDCFVANAPRNDGGGLSLRAKRGNPLFFIIANETRKAINLLKYLLLRQYKFLLVLRFYVGLDTISANSLYVDKIQT